MQQGEIKIGTVYRCRGGWFRRPTHIEDDYVHYDLGWTPEANKSRSGGPLEWFANTAYEAVRS